MKAIMVVLVLTLPVMAGAQSFAKSRYDDHGRLAVTYSVSDQDNYRFTTYHENGQRKESGTYHNGRKSGIWKSWDEDGRLVARGRYADGVKTGKWKVVNVDGRQWFEISFMNDHVLAACRKDGHGHILAQR